MRDLFEEAKKRAPCIVFIDELDAIGKARGGVAAVSTHDEREQTLNQLLVEIDGFSGTGGVIIMAATNRPEVLDPALVRAGRFDRQVVVDRPDLKGREEILKKKGRVMNEEEKRRVAWHECGHTLVALSVDHANPVHRVTIIPRSIGALGVTLQLPSEERYLITRDELLDRIAVMMGGRAAEAIAFGDVSTGAHNDLERATETARAMVTRFGMSDELGPLTFGRSHTSRFLGGAGMEERNYSEETARKIDADVRSIVEGQNQRARKLLEEKRPLLERMAVRLLEVETLDRPALEEIVGLPMTAAAPARG